MHLALQGLYSPSLANDIARFLFFPHEHTQCLIYSFCCLSHHLFFFLAPYLLRRDIAEFIKKTAELSDFLRSDMALEDRTGKKSVRYRGKRRHGRLEEDMIRTGY